MYAIETEIVGELYQWSVTEYFNLFYAAILVHT